MPLTRKPVQSLARTIHIYSSMSLLLVMLFFAITGITLNRPDWFGAEGPERQQWEIEVPAFLLGQEDGSLRPDNQALVHYLRQQPGIRGLASSVDVYTVVEDGELLEGEASLDFKGPGYNASVYIDLLDRVAELETQDYGTIAWLNDLHKGRNTGEAWKWFIDFSALIMVLFIITGVIILLPKKRSVRSAMTWTGVGSVATALIYFASF
ncbi:PepSY-associated TM helix domain-containing protein [Ferrimonas marina]|uniref:PepSY-associated TM region n=1 Tax=Ferrimonas marina TaxID=299255 RepID=A0A1M5VBR4_9GAMM|nr:PepSY-associated TM helix domain-containing protein [Ferrimonas marina]SHH72699.1 hypothetical protein SAMN02745129_2697 [Ferrimonas marina]